jgi:uncharacterized protein (UPF0128 family)
MLRKFLKYFSVYKDAEVNNTLREILENNKTFRKLVIKAHNTFNMFDSKPEGEKLPETKENKEIGFDKQKNELKEGHQNKE